MQNALGAFCNTFDLHYAIISLENQFLVFVLSGQVLLYKILVLLGFDCLPKIGLYSDIISEVILAAILLEY